MYCNRRFSTERSVHVMQGKLCQGVEEAPVLWCACGQTARLGGCQGTAALHGRSSCADLHLRVHVLGARGIICLEKLLSLQGGFVRAVEAHPVGKEPGDGRWLAHPSV